jgi:plastocyanin
VTIDATQFQEATTRIRLGDSVVWTNNDLLPHTVTGAGFESGTMTPGSTWRYTPTARGVFPYLCRFHPTMKATLEVE